MSTYSLLLGWVSIQVLSRTLASSVVAGVLDEVRRSGMHASFSVLDCDEYIERKLLSVARHSRSRQEGRVGGYLTTRHCRKREQRVLAIILHGHFLEIEVFKRNVRSGFRLHSRISLTAFFLQVRQEIGGSTAIDGGFESHLCFCDNLTCKKRRTMTTRRQGRREETSMSGKARKTGYFRSCQRR